MAELPVRMIPANTIGPEFRKKKTFLYNVKEVVYGNGGKFVLELVHALGNERRLYQIRFL